MPLVILIVNCSWLQDSFGRLHERGKEVPKATKLLTKLFPNKVTIHMPQVGILHSCWIYIFYFLFGAFLNMLWKLNHCRMKHFLSHGSTNWIEMLKPSKWRETWITCALWVTLFLSLMNFKFWRLSWVLLKMIINVHYFIFRFLVDVEWNVKDLKHYASMIKHLQMKVCFISYTTRCHLLMVLFCF